MRIQGYPDPGDGLRLHLNENTGGCSPRVLDAIRRVAAERRVDVSVVPRRSCSRARAHFDVDPDWVLLTNGLDEGILMAAVGHIARARASTTPKRSFRCRRSIRIRTPRPRSARRRSACRPGRTTRFQTDEVHRGDHAADADDLSEHAEQPDRAS